MDYKVTVSITKEKSPYFKDIYFGPQEREVEIGTVEFGNVRLRARRMAGNSSWGITNVDVDLGKGSFFPIDITKSDPTIRRQFVPQTLQEKLDAKVAEVRAESKYRWPTNPHEREVKDLSVRVKMIERRLNEISEEKLRQRQTAKPKRPWWERHLPLK